MNDIIYEKVSLQKLHELLKKQPSEPDISGSRKIKGFKFLYDDVATIRLNGAKRKYNISNKLKPFEVHKEKREYDTDYDISIIARKDEEIVGFLGMRWFYDYFQNDDFWNYRNRFVTVKDQYKKQGIATNLYKLLEKQPEIQGKVLRFGNFTIEGEAYIKKIIPKIFKNNNYYILPKEHWDFSKPMPEKYGCYID